jgi:hypothetical protein
VPTCSLDADTSIEIHINSGCASTLNVKTVQNLILRKQEIKK